MIPLIYFGGMFILIALALALNAKFKWLTKTNSEEFFDDIPLGMLIGLSVTYLVFWPITVPLTFVGFLVYLAYYFFIPNS